MKTERIIIYVVIMVSLVLSVTALCRSLQRTAGFDYIGVIVGILALLVTALITWNIYSVVDFNRKKDELIRQEQIVKKTCNIGWWRIVEKCRCNRTKFFCNIPLFDNQKRTHELGILVSKSCSVCDIKIFREWKLRGV